MDSFETIFDEETADYSGEMWEADEESKYWIHRTSMPQLFFNTNFSKNGCPMILTYEEMTAYKESGKDIVDCISLDLFYSDEEERKKVLDILSSSGLNEEKLGTEIKNKCLLLVQGIFSNGLYMSDQYGEDLTRIAHRYSIKHMKKMIDSNNFGFNDWRGIRNLAIILEIPVDCEDEVFIDLGDSVSIGTQYLQEQSISKAVSPEYIKGAIIKLENKNLFVKNPTFVKRNGYDL